MQGKRVAITGASGGIGLATARLLAGKGADLVFVVRNPAKAEAAAAEVRAVAPKCQIDFVYADLYSLEAVRKAGAELRARFDKLDVLINNAGGVHGERVLTEDGIERTFALNHLAPFVLTYEVRELLMRAAPARVVTVSSEGHRLAHTDWADAARADRSFSQWRTYGMSKLANILFAHGLSTRLAPHGVTSNALHPGVVGSDFGSDGGWLVRTGMPLVRRFLKTIDQGAATSVHVASAAALAGVTATYFKDSKAATPSRAARSDAHVRALWDVSEALTGIRWH